MGRVCVVYVFCVLFSLLLYDVVFFIGGCLIFGVVVFVFVVVAVFFV